MLRTPLALVVLPLVILGCEEDPSEDFTWDINTVPDPTPTDTGTATAPVLEGVVTIAPVLEFDGRFGLASNIEEPCSANTADAEYQEVRCRLDAEELDLFFHGWGYDVLVQSNTCTYLSITNYMYQVWEDGFGPGSVYVRIGPGGEILEQKNFEPCQYDYTDIGGPNCCYGTYVQTTVYVDVDGNEIATSGIADWGGGPIGDCYEGAAYHSDITALLDNGVPATIYFDVDEDVNSITSVRFDGPIETPAASNLTVANYLNAEDKFPVALGRPYSQPDYLIRCFDDAEEVQIDFRLEVRDWDTVEEYIADGDPDIGKSPGPGIPGPLEGTGSGDPLNDRFDWRDFGIALIDYVGFLN